MDVTLEEKGAFDRHLHVRIPADRLQGIYNSELERTLRTIQMPGFRPGKVPRNLVEKRYGIGILHDAADKLIRETMQPAIDGQNIRLAGPPELELSNLKLGEEFAYVIQIQIFPEVVPVGHKGLKITRITATPQAEDVDRAVEELRANEATFNADPEAKAAEGDEVVFDFTGTIDGVPFDGGSSEAFTLRLGSGRFVPGFESQLVGAAVGERRMVTVTMPDNYPSELANKEAVFDCTMREVRTRTLAPVDDALAAKAGVTEGGVEALRARILNKMTFDAEKRTKDLLKKRLFAQLMEANPMELPTQLVERQKDDLREETKQILKGRGLDPEKLGVNIDALRPDMEKEARERVSIGLLIGAIARVEQIQVDESQVEAALDAISVPYGDRAAEIKAALRTMPERMDEIRGSTLEQQVINWIVDNGEVTAEEVSFNALLQWT